MPSITSDKQTERNQFCAPRLSHFSPDAAGFQRRYRHAADFSDER